MGKKSVRREERPPPVSFFLKDFRPFPEEVPPPVQEVVYPGREASAVSAPVVGAWVRTTDSGYFDVRLELLLAHHVQVGPGVAAVRFIRLEDFESRGVMTAEREPPSFWVYRDEDVGGYKRDARWSFVDEALRGLGLPLVGDGRPLEDS